MDTIDFEVKVDKVLKDSVMSDMAEIEGVVDYLKQTMHSDVMRFFNNATTDAQRDQIRGHHMLAKYLHEEIKKIKDKDLHKSK